MLTAHVSQMDITSHAFVMLDTQEQYARQVGYINNATYLSQAQFVLAISQCLISFYPYSMHDLIHDSNHPHPGGCVIFCEDKIDVYGPYRATYPVA